MSSFSEPGRRRSSLTTELAVRFVERESAGFARALRDPWDSHLLREAVRWHDDAHRTWLSLLAAYDDADGASAVSLHRLYAFHGRLAELLQRGCAGGGPGRALLHAHLWQLTRDAVARLRADAAAPAGRVTRGAAQRARPPEGRATERDQEERLA